MRQLKNEDRIALLVVWYVDEKGDMFQWSACVITPIKVVQLSWGILNLDSEHQKLRYSDISHNAEGVKSIGINLE